MNIPGLSGSTGGSGGAQASTATQSATSKDEFLKLLVAQLQHQDPLDPQKGAEFVAQLAQFTSIEQGAQTNSELATIAGNQLSSASASWASLVGRNATVRADAITLDGTTLPTMGAHLDSASSKTQMVVTDAAGKTVRTIDLGPQPAGEIQVPFDGRGDDGKVLAAGTYGVTIKASGGGSDPVNAYAELRGTISALEFASGAPKFRIGSTTVAPADVVSIQN